MTEEKLTVIIPTVNRTGCLRRLLESIAGQQALPHEVIIIDAGARNISGELAGFDDLQLRYVHMHPPSLTRQKNAGIEHASKHATLIGFIDDDIVLRDGCLARMLYLWKEAPDEVGGASFNNVSGSLSPAGAFERFFAISSPGPGRILKSGFNTQISSIDATRRVEWLFGGITVWRRGVVEDFKFDEWFDGNAYCDDIDYSLRVGKRYRLMVVKDAEAMHVQEPMPLKKEYRCAHAQTTNRLYFVKKHRGFSLAMCCWAHTGLCIKNVFKGIIRLRPDSFLRAAGILSGMLNVGGASRPRRDSSYD